MKRAALCFVQSVVVCVVASTACFAQTEVAPGKIIAFNGCSSTTNFETGNYRVRSSQVDDPFAFLWLVKRKKSDLSAKIRSLVDGKPFQYEVAVNQALQLIEAEKFLSDSADVRVQVSLEFLTVEHCQGLELDLVYHVYSTQIPQVLSGTPESRSTEKKAPQQTVGQTEAGSPIHLAPSGGYNASERASGGGRLEIQPRGADWLPFRSFTVEGQGSSAMRFVSAGLKGGKDSQGWLAHSEWIVNYESSSSPTNAGNFSRGTFSGQFSAVTKAFANGNLTGRFGFLIGGGNLQSSLQNVNMASNTVPNTGYFSSKVYAGISSRLPHNVFATSYGLELGSTSGTGMDWRKHIGDVQHEFWYPVGDHHIIEVESRFTVGALEVPGMVPVSERFFGGGSEELFFPGDSWRIRANPVIRAIPANRFYLTADGAGAEDFLSYNLTAAWAAWRKPLFPSDLSRDADFTRLLNGQIHTATSIEQNDFASKDQHFGDLVRRLPAVQKDLEDLKSVVQSAEIASHGQFVAEFKACASSIGVASSRVRSALGAKDGMQYGDVRALLPVDKNEDRLQRVLSACGDRLNGQLKSPEITASLGTLDSEFQRVQTDFLGIDQQQASCRATQEMAFVHRTLNTLIKEVNMFSISPVVVFDVAHIGPAKNGLGGTRYGPGGGIRFALASTVNFTLGYAWNPQHQPGEGPGAMFFSLQTRDLFH